MANDSHEASRVSELTYAGEQVPLSLSTADQPGPGPYQGDCPEHGVHSGLERDEPLVLDREGDSWRLPENYAVSYCEECVAEYRREAALLAADSVDEALERDRGDLVDAIEGLAELNWRHLRTAFRPDDPSTLERVPVGDGDAGGEA